MKIIISRKGFDSSAGGTASPILPDGALMSMPIPDSAAPHCYGNINLMGVNLGEVAESITNGRVSGKDRVHLDPDLQACALPRKSGWLPLFGQTGAAQGHLIKMGIGPGDLFLFFGWFRETCFEKGRLRFVKGAPHVHVFFGWLQIGRIIDLNLCKPEPWMADHPHCFGDRGVHNVLYEASPELKITGRRSGLAGAGLFPKHAPHLTLTARGENRSVWRLPQWFHPHGRESSLSYHGDPSRWSKEEDWVRLRSAYRGQDFVLDGDHYPESLSWAMDLIKKGVG